MKMRVLGLGLVLTLVAGAPAARAESGALEAESRITAVTVFADRAAITRTASVDLKESGAIRVGPLPSHVDPDSLSAKGQGEAQVTLHGVRLEAIQLADAQDPRAKEIEAELRKIQQQQQQMQRLKLVLDKERKYLEAIPSSSTERSDGALLTRAPSVQEASALLTFLDEAYLKTYDREQKADADAQELQRQWDRLQRELANLSQGRQRQETFAMIDVVVGKPGRFTLEVAYRVGGAVWQPSYEARAVSDGADVQFLSYGVVRQQTGEDWKDVQLTLSTARPAMGGSLPKLQPVYLVPVEMAPQQFGMLSKMRANADMSVQTAYAPDEMKDEADNRAAPAAMEMQASIAVAEVASQGPAVTYKLPKQESIPADSQPHKVPIGSRTFKGEMQYGVSPRWTPAAFAHMRVKNASQELLLAGPVSIYLNGGFLSTGQLEPVAPDELFELYLGVDERMKVEYRKLKERAEVSVFPGLRGKTKTIEYEYLTTVENFTGKAVDLTVFDLVPVAERGEITVDEVKQNPAQVEKVEDVRPGVFRWKVKLEPGAKQEFRLAYRVRHPADMPVQPQTRGY